MKKRRNSAAGYSLVELLVGTVLFTIIAGTLFSFLMSSQIRYNTESTVSQAFQQGNVAIDEMTRDIHSAGYPPKSAFNLVVANANASLYAVPFSWSPSYPGTPCLVGSFCTIPGDDDLIVETQTNPTDPNNNPVRWIRYSLQGTTLMRAAVPKTPFGDPAASTAGQLIPYLENVVNQSKALPVFSYRFDATTPASSYFPSNIRDVNICLVIQSTKQDPQTHQFPVVTITGQATRFNPNQ